MRWFEAAILSLILLAGCSPDADPRAGPAATRPVLVTVTTAELGPAPLAIRTIGTVQSQASVTVRPQVGARVSEVPAPEGTDVTAGQLLVRLDARPFEASLAEEEANLAKARALAIDARALAGRAREAQVSGAMNPREVEQADAQAQAAEAEVQAAQAVVETARLNLAYCTVEAPFAGRLGQFHVKPGSIVRANETDLVELSQVDPIDVAFAVPEDRIAGVRGGLAQGPLLVEVLLPENSDASAAGELTFVDNRVDPATGTIRLKATFANADRRLWPGQFVNVTLTLGVERDRVLVPEAAVEPSQQGPSIWVVKPDHTVELRPVVALRTVEGRSVLASGVEAGETVVVEGQLRLAPGMKVETRPTPEPGR